MTSNPYWYKRGSVRSTHSANYDGTTVASGSDGTNWKAGLLNNTGGYTTNYNKNETKDDVANIRCTYCHDVHVITSYSIHYTKLYEQRRHRVCTP